MAVDRASPRPSGFQKMEGPLALGVCFSFFLLPSFCSLIHLLTPVFLYPYLPHPLLFPCSLLPSSLWLPLSYPSSSQPPLLPLMSPPSYPSALPYSSSLTLTAYLCLPYPPSVILLLFLPGLLPSSPFLTLQLPTLSHILLHFTPFPHSLLYLSPLLTHPPLSYPASYFHLIFYTLLSFPSHSFAYTFYPSNFTFRSLYKYI